MHRILLAGTLAIIGLTLLAGQTVDHDSASAGDDPLAFPIWGDLDCNGELSSLDSVALLADLAGIMPGQTPPCPPLRTEASVVIEGHEALRTWGDVDCDGEAGLSDALLILLSLSGSATAAAGNGSCPEIEEALEGVFAKRVSAVHPQWADFGDAPDGTPTGYTFGSTTGNFATNPSNGGPVHPFAFTVWLGDAVSPEPVPLDTLDGADDGVQMLDMAECDSSAALVMLNTTAMTEVDRQEPVYINIFADWNKDGRWNGADSCANEWSLQNAAIDVSDTSGFVSLGLEFPGGVQVDEFWLRVMVTIDPISEDPVLVAGETEDYLVKGGNVFVPAADNGARSVAGEVTIQAPDGRDADFFCRGGIVPHGPNKTLRVEVQQTAESYASGVRIKQLTRGGANGPYEPGEDDPLDDPGAAGDSSDNHEAVNAAADVGDPPRMVFRFNLPISATIDGPDHIEGPYEVDIWFSGIMKAVNPIRDVNFDASATCSFWVDHSDISIQVPPLDEGSPHGFRGLPGHADKNSANGVTSVKRLDIVHGGRLANIVSSAGLAGTYNASTIRAYTTSGQLIDVEAIPGKDGQFSIPGAEIERLKIAREGRGITIDKTSRDPPTPRVEELIIRIEGLLPDNSAFVDYFRIVIIHGSKGSKDVKELLEKLALAVDGYGLLDEDQPTAIAYISNDTSIRSRIPAEVGLLYEEDEVCSIGGSVAGDISPAQTLLGVFDLIRGPNDMIGFIGLYQGGGDDLFQRDVNAVNGCYSSSTNLTGYGPGAQNHLERGSRCGAGYVYAQFTPQGFGTHAVKDATGPFDVMGGDMHRYPHCYAHPIDGDNVGIIGSTPGNDDRSNLAHLPIQVICGPTCVQLTGTSGSTLLLEADAPSTHLTQATVSPDLSLIAWVRGQGADFHIWVGDFDPNVPSITNPRQLTTEGQNYWPTWSPMSDRLAFVSSRDGNLEVYLMNADGSDQTNFTNTPAVHEASPAWAAP